MGSGFCVLNKTAVLIKQIASINQSPLKYIIVGTDVNRDNGLSHVLMESAAHLDICRVDVFDSRVYPGQDHAFIDIEFNSMGTDVGQKIKCWSRGTIKYFAVDLSLTTRETDSIHPALVFALKQMAEHIERAKMNGQRIMLFLPTGWDSHEDETAFCGKFVNGQIMSKTEAQTTRFNDRDLTHFYSKVFELYYGNKEFIVGMYWGLEGGYFRPMYEQQIQLMVSLILEKLVHGK